MQWLSGRRDRIVDKQARDLVTETESFLCGSLADLFDNPTCSGVPHWVWTNVLAHGTTDDLRRAANASADGSLSPYWHRARSFLAAEVLAVADCPRSLERVQAATLVPLEHQLASKDLVVMGPAEWVTMVLAGLRSYQDSSPPCH